jgi:hypothetical protein
MAYATANEADKDSLSHREITPEIDTKTKEAISQKTTIVERMAFGKKD